MEYKCELCPRVFIYHYAYYQHLHIEHRHYQCEICNELLPSLKSFKQHPHIHIKREYDLCEDRWKFEQEFEKKVEMEVWVKSMVFDSASEIHKIQQVLKDIIMSNEDDTTKQVNGMERVHQFSSESFNKLKGLVPRLDYEEKYLNHYANINGTVTKFACDMKVHKPPKYRPAFPPRSDWDQ